MSKIRRENLTKVSNPILLPEVQEGVAAHLDFDSFKNFRLACWEFYYNTQTAFADAIPVSLTPESNVNFSWPGRKSIPRAYELKGWDFQGHPLLTTEQHAAFYSNFVKICGPHVEYLKLTKCIIFKETDSSLKSPPHGFIVLLQKLGPEMVTLEIQDCWFHSQQESRAEKLPHLRKLVITKCRGLLAPMSLIQFPNLTELVIHGVINSTICDYDYISTFAMLRRFYQRNPILNLTRLDTLCLEERSASLIVANFPLKHLQISVTTESETRNIVEHYGPRLETLQLHKLCRKNNREVFWNFPFGVKFEILTELELWGDFVPSLDFLTAIPLLHKLRLDVNCLDLKQNVNRQTEILEIDDLIPQSTGLMSKNFEMVLLTEISFDWEAAPDSWFQLASWMPYLKSIHAPVSAQAFKTIFENWDRLEIFRARYGSCIDDDALLSVDLPRTLQKFKIETGCGQSHISNASIRKIFPGREKFQELTLSATFEQISFEAEVNLKRNIPCVEIFRGSCMNYHDAYYHNDIPKECFWTLLTAEDERMDE